MIVTEREREAETQAEGEAGSMHREPDVGFDPGSPGSRPGPKAGAKPLRHPGIPTLLSFKRFYLFIHERQRERKRHRQRKKQAPCREPDVGLDPRTLGSRPDPEADAQPLSHPGVPVLVSYPFTP